MIPVVGNLALLIVAVTLFVATLRLTKKRR